jgi:hypothetical protein
MICSAYSPSRAIFSEMVRVIDINVPAGRFAGRIVYALFRSFLILLLFYYLPTHLLAFLSHVPETYMQLAQYVASSFSNSPLPFLGMVIALIAFVEIVIKGTWVYGAILISSALAWLSFDLVLLSKGVLFANLVPTGMIQAYHLPPSAVSVVTWSLVSMVLFFLLMELGYIVRGIRIIRKNRKTRMVPHVPLPRASHVES